MTTKNVFGAVTLFFWTKQAEITQLNG